MAETTTPTPTIAEQVSSTRQDIATARTNLQAMRSPEAGAQALRRVGRGAMKNRALRKAQTGKVDAAKKIGLKSLAAQEESFELSVAQGAPEFAKPEILSKTVGEAKDYITNRIAVLQDKISSYKERANRYSDKDDEYRERKYDYKADNYDAEMRAYQKALGKDDATLSKEYFSGYIKDYARYARDKEEARNDYKLAKWKGEKATEAKVAELEKAGYTKQVIYKYDKGNPTTTDYAMYNKGTGDWETVATFKTPGQVDVSKMNLQGYVPSGFSTVKVGGKDWTSKVSVGVYKGDKGYATPYQTTAQLNQVELAEVYKPTTMVSSVTEPTIASVSAASIARADIRKPSLYTRVDRFLGGYLPGGNTPEEVKKASNTYQGVAYSDSKTQAVEVGTGLVATEQGRDKSGNWKMNTRTANLEDHYFIKGIDGEWIDMGVYKEFKQTVSDTKPDITSVSSPGMSSYGVSSMTKNEAFTNLVTRKTNIRDLFGEPKLYVKSTTPFVAVENSYPSGQGTGIINIPTPDQQAKIDKASYDGSIKGIAVNAVGLIVAGAKKYKGAVVDPLSQAKIIPTINNGKLEFTQLAGTVTLKNAGDTYEFIGGKKDELIQKIKSTYDEKLKDVPVIKGVTTVAGGALGVVDKYVWEPAKQGMPVGSEGSPIRTAYKFYTGSDTTPAFGDGKKPATEERGFMTISKDQEKTAQKAGIPYWVVSTPKQNIEMGNVLSEIPSYDLTAGPMPTKDYSMLTDKSEFVGDAWRGFTSTFMNKPSGEMTPWEAAHGEQREGLGLSQGSFTALDAVLPPKYILKKTAGKLIDFEVGSFKTARDVRVAEELYQWEKANRNQDLSRLYISSSVVGDAPIKVVDTKVETVPAINLFGVFKGENPFRKEVSTSEVSYPSIDFEKLQANAGPTSPWDLTLLRLQKKKLIQFMTQLLILIL